MDGVQGSEDVEPVRESVIRRRRRWSDQEKTQIVRELQRPGAVLQEVAERHGLHPGLLTRWRTQHRTVAKKAPVREAKLLPVRVRPPRQPPRLARGDDIGEEASKSGSI